MPVETIQRKPSVPEVGLNFGLHAGVRSGQLRFDLVLNGCVLGDLSRQWTPQEFEFLEVWSGVFSALKCREGNRFSEDNGNM
jgi:hypothetical protein